MHASAREAPVCTQSSGRLQLPSEVGVQKLCCASPHTRPLLLQVDIFLHTYDLDRIENARSHEFTDLNTTEWRLLKPLAAEVTSQTEFLRKYKCAFSRSFPASPAVTRASPA